MTPNAIIELADFLGVLKQEPGGRVVLFRHQRPLLALTVSDINACARGAGREFAMATDIRIAWRTRS
ncbi:hypothetical protein ACFYWP_34915 [Actinacidiphila glaucinigra]|uniref:hypothetical protein n=1 Tax=Actinacidiphila glaucinigra TaxID=235986 RepID=UPI0036D0A123